MTSSRTLRNRQTACTLFVNHFLRRLRHIRTEGRSNGKVVPVQVMKVHRGKEVQFSVFVINTVHWGEKVGFTPRPFFLRGKSAQYTMNTKLGEPQSQSGRFVDEIILKLLFEFEPRFLGCPVGSVVTIATTLSRLTDANRGHPVKQTAMSTSTVHGNV